MLLTGGAPPLRGAWRTLRLALLGGLLAVGAASSEALPPVKQVLLLQSFHRGSLPVDQFTGAFRVHLDHLAGQPVNAVQVTVGPAGFIGADELSVVEYIRATFADHPPPDLIVSVAGPAAVFARKYRQQLFPEVPLLLASVDQRWLRGAPIHENETAVAVDNNFSLVVDDILQVLPETRQIFVLIGSGPLGHFWRRELENEFARFRDRVTFVWSDELSLAGILRRCANLPDHTAIMYVSFGTDARGGSFADEQVFADLHATANAPMFSSLSPFLGHGIVGGSMISISDLARSTSEVANRILNGAPPESLRVPPTSPGRPTFDWRELRRWEIPESRLPPGSVVQFRGPSLWGEYKLPIVAAVAALVFQALLIARLLVERRARRRAELDSRRNLALAADANRRETMSALTTSIGHELGQPLSAIAQNARALHIMVTANRAARDATSEIVADIQAEAVLATQIIDRHRKMLRSRQLQKGPMDLHSVIGESLALVAHDMKARQIDVALDLLSTNCVIDGDPVLLQQVLVNLIKNAMDAVAETQPSRRRMTIRSADRGGDVEVSVNDMGTGLPPETLATLFTPFVTTKAHGLGIGLTIAKSIVEAHGGTIAAHENPDGGATFTVTLPCRATPEPGSRPSGTAVAS